MTQEQPLPETSSKKEEGNTKQCPACGKTIKAEALICRFCRARFEVRERGYCLNDHAIVDVKDGKCVQCGNAAQDVHFESTLIASPSTKPEQRAAEPVQNVQQTATQTLIPTEGLKRPGCVTAYAVLLILGAGLFVLGGLSGWVAYADLDPGMGGTITVIALLGAAINAAIAIGLWQLKNWARITIIILTGLGIAFGILSIGTAIFAPTPNVPTYLQGAYGSQKMMGIFINIIGMAINSTLFDWFIKNGKYFVKKADATANPVPARQTASPPRKQTAQPSTRAPKPQPQSGLRGELLKKIEVYAEAMHYLATCGDFNEQKFAKLDAILDKAGAAFGPAKRREMLHEAAFILPTRSTGGMAELHVQLQDALAQGFQMFNEILAKSSPTPDTAREVMRIIEKYKVKA